MNGTACVVVVCMASRRMSTDASILDLYIHVSLHGTHYTRAHRPSTSAGRAEGRPHFFEFMHSQPQQHGNVTIGLHCLDGGRSLAVFLHESSF